MTVRNLINRIPRRLISLVFILAIVVFLVLYLKGIQFHKLEHVRISWLWLAGGSVLALAYRYMAVFIWRVILRCLDVKRLPPFSVMATVFAKAWMARYIPGTITWVAGRIYLAAEYGISKSRLTVSSLLEGGMQIVAGIVIALPMIGFDSRAAHIAWQIKLLAVVLSVCLLITLAPPIFNRLLHAAHVIVKRKQPGDELRVNGKAVARSFVLFCVASIITGFANFLVARSIDHHLGVSALFYLIGTFSLAGALGIATPFLPSGIGVRDGVLLVLLSLIMPKELALAITVLSRLWGVAIDILFFGTAVGWNKLHHRTPPQVLAHKSAAGG